MKTAIFFICTFTLIGFSQNRTINVPDRLMVCGMEVKINSGGKRALEDIAKGIIGNEKYFNNKQERIYLHLPLVEKSLKSEGVPSDFKFLCMMESSMVADAVSTSNAVGFWQFKKESAQEVGLRVDQWVDERKNLVSSTIGAARYLKKNNRVLDNWIFTTLSYNLGLGGVQKVMDKNQIGAKSYLLNENSPRYLQKFVAYKLIFEQNPLKTPLQKKLQVHDYGTELNLENICRKLDISKTELLEFNKWLNGEQIPNDKKYPLIVLGKDSLSDFSEKENDEVLTDKDAKESKQEQTTVFKKIWHVFSSDDESHEVPVTVQINGLKAIQARKGDNSHKLAMQGGIRYKKFLKYNELRSFDELMPEKFYFWNLKRTKPTCFIMW
ncbi:MAG: lytic transglycosylase domain-containing protein [Cytophagales bacterium]